MSATFGEQLVGKQKFSVLLLEISIKSKLMLTFFRYNQNKTQNEVTID